MVTLPVVVVLAGYGGGCSCQPTIPTPPPPPSEDTSQESATTGDTGPEKPCYSPEEEPNDSLDAPNALVMEQRGCGLIDPAADFDYWSFTLEDDAWLAVKVAADNGSIADLTFLLSPSDGGWIASRSDNPESLDATLVFPAPAGTYALSVSEQDFNGGARYGYTALVSEAKPPVEFTSVESEPNDDEGAAPAVASGDRIYGTMSGNGANSDLDWYQITIPAGKHTLSIDVDAFDVYSAADLTVYLWDDELNKLPLGCKESCGPADPGCIPCAMEGGLTGVELDPLGTYESDGAEVVWIEVLEALGREGPAMWYVLSIGVE